ncbi:hypothetical protein BJX96DRAFT_162726 [Aspergillus floccosus]
MPDNNRPPRLSLPSSPLFDLSKPINDNFWRRRPRRGCVLMLTDTLCAKYGSHVHLSATSTMRFLAQHTSIPVPKVYCAFTQNISGNGWVHRHEKSKTKHLSQLRSIITEMRTLQPRGGTGVASVDSGSSLDCHIPGSTLHFGPFYTQSGNWPLKFTHYDLSSLNILARGDGIVGVVDWEAAGWHPSYWEYTSAYQVNPQNSFWVHEIDKFLQLYSIAVFRILPHIKDARPSGIRVRLQCL